MRNPPPRSWPGATKRTLHGSTLSDTFGKLAEYRFARSPPPSFVLLTCRRSCGDECAYRHLTRFHVSLQLEAVGEQGPQHRRDLLERRTAAHGDDVETVGVDPARAADKLVVQQFIRQQDEHPQRCVADTEPDRLLHP